MRIVADTDSPGPACRLVAEALGVEIAIIGLTAGELRYRLEGQGHPWRWSDLAGRGPVTVSLASDPLHEPVEGKPVVYENDLPDGRVRLVSGEEAEFRVEPRHADSGGILPYCFHAAVAQQLARAGVLTLHAAGIATPHGGVLAIGRKGAGKSTLTASALCAGFGVVSDDWLLASLVHPVVRVERMRSFMMLRKGWATDQLRRFLPAELVRESKARPRLHLWLPHNDDRFPCATDIGTICVLERPRGGRRKATSSSPLSPGQSLALITESTMPIVLTDRLPVERASLLPRLSSAMAGSCFRTHAGMDLIETPGIAWRSLLTSISAPLQPTRTVDPPRNQC